MNVASQPHRQSRMDVLTPIILLVGGLLIPVLGWVAGVALLWTSRAWTRRDKVIGTLVIPGGLTIPVLMLSVGLAAPASEGCGPTTTTPGQGVSVICSSSTIALSNLRLVALIVIAFIAPVLTTVYLIRRARSPGAEPVEPSVAV
jgi:hypothetical protein